MEIESEDREADRPALWPMCELRRDFSKRLFRRARRCLKDSYVPSRRRYRLSCGVRGDRLALQSSYAFSLLKCAGDHLCGRITLADKKQRRDDCSAYGAPMKRE